jgi:hypothetical protein
MHGHRPLTPVHQGCSLRLCVVRLLVVVYVCMCVCLCVCACVCVALYVRLWVGQSVSVSACACVSGWIGRLPATELGEKRQVQRLWADAGGSSSTGPAATDAAAKRVKAEPAEHGAEPLPGLTGAVPLSMRALAESTTETVGTADPVGDFEKMAARRDRDLVQPGTPTVCACVDHAHAPPHMHYLHNRTCTMSSILSFVSVVCVSVGG